MSVRVQACRFLASVSDIMIRGILPFVALAWTLPAAPAIAADTRTEPAWLLRVGATLVSPTGSTTQGPGTIEFDDGTTVTAGGAYAFNRHWRVELELMAPHDHDVEYNGMGVASADFTPMILSVQYRPAWFERVQPYVGLGAAAMRFSDEHLQAGIPGGDLELDDSFGLAASLGVEWLMTDRWSVNADVRAWKSDTDASLNGVEVGNFDLDPIALGLGVGYSF
jgi:outer membrane protein